MKAKRGKRKAVPAIVPRFLKGAVTMGVIPMLAGGCEKPRRVQPPVVAYMAPPEDAMRPQPPVVAAYKVQPVVAAYAVDAAIVRPPGDSALVTPSDAAALKPTDAAVSKRPADAAVARRPVDAAALRPPPPPVVAAMVRPDLDPTGPVGPAVVAAYMPRDQPKVGSGAGSATPKKPKKK